MKMLLYSNIKTFRLPIVSIDGVEGATFRGFFIRAIDPFELDYGIFYNYEGEE